MSVAMSLALHALVMVLVWRYWPVPVPPIERIELSLVKAGEPVNPSADPAVPADVVGAAAPPAPAAQPRRAAPRSAAATPVPEAPDGTASSLPRADAAPDSVASAAPPASFRDWRSASAILPTGGAFGGEAVDRFGRDRCHPPDDRPKRLVYLLFDSSGSMSVVRRSQALACASQYAKASLAGGASVVVGNFARGTTMSPPTQSLFDIEVALRAASDSTATILPSREMQGLWDNAGVASDLVIISDGWFETPADTMVWYKYFLEIHPDNRAVMYTVGTPGHRASVARLREVGFHVYMYETVGRGGG